jgi:hypothetical protein
MVLILVAGLIIFLAAGFIAREVLHAVHLQTALIWGYLAHDGDGDAWGAVRLLAAWNALMSCQAQRS